MARNLRKQANHTVGILVSDLRNPFYADLATILPRGSTAAPPPAGVRREGVALLRLISTPAPDLRSGADTSTADVGGAVNPAACTKLEVWQEY